jgi:hypothetical protein
VALQCLQEKDKKTPCLHDRREQHFSEDPRASNPSESVLCVWRVRSGSASCGLSVVVLIVMLFEWISELYM